MSQKISSTISNINSQKSSHDIKNCLFWFWYVYVNFLLFYASKIDSLNHEMFSCSRQQVRIFIEHIRRIEMHLLAWNKWFTKLTEPSIQFSCEWVFNSYYTFKIVYVRSIARMCAAIFLTVLCAEFDVFVSAIVLKKVEKKTVSQEQTNQLQIRNSFSKSKNLSSSLLCCVRVYI